MKRFSAQFIITNSGDLLKRGVITTHDDGTIISVEDTSGNLKEEHTTEFYNGIIIPGFVNCHCHLELSHMRGATEPGGGLGKFLSEIRNNREESQHRIVNEARKADNEMYENGINLCADICNTDSTFNLKKESKIKYINLIEVFGVDSETAHLKIIEITRVANKAEEAGLEWYMVPHAAYSMSVELLQLLRQKSIENKVTSIHFMETSGEKEFLEKRTGALADTYEKLGLLSYVTNTVKNHADAVLNEITSSGSLLLVHNTFTDREIISEIRERKRLYWCLCPNSNIYIENTVPRISLLTSEGCEIVIGTDSLASNTRLDILEELKTLQVFNPSLKIPEIIIWATLNGARALGKEEMFGSIVPGKKPGLLILQNVDLQNMKLLPETRVTRLI
jgi:cytosine/adenosine deaminase-related metal-dependent hydrolase